MATRDSSGKVGLFTCVTMIVGSMIGSAIFSLSGSTMVTAGPASVISWAVAAVVMLIYGFVCTELSTRFPKSGGVFVFPSKALDRHGHGKFWGWISTWGYINSNIVAIAFAAICTGQTVTGGFGLPTSWQVPIALASVAFCLVLNCVNFKLTGKLNSILVAAMVAAMVFFIGTCFISGGWNAGNFTPFLGQGTKGKLGFLAAVPTAMVGYGSIVAMAFLVSEVKNPSRNIPKAVLIAMAVVVALYVLIIVATMGYVTSASLQESGMSFQPLAAACLAGLQDNPYLNTVVNIATILALLTTMLVVTALTARALQAAANDGAMPSLMAKENRYGAAAPAAIAICILSGVVACFQSLIWVIVNLGALFASITITINIASLYAARRDNPSAEGIFKMPFGKILPAIALVVLVVCYIPDIVTGGWTIWVYTVAWYAVGIIWFKLSEKRNQ